MNTPPTYPLVPVTKLAKDGLYLRLFHGRMDPKETPPGWGFDGPYIGPVRLTMTYGDLKVHHPEFEGFRELSFTEGCIALDGAFYGDMDILSGHELAAQVTEPIPVLTWDQFDQLSPSTP